MIHKNSDCESSLGAFSPCQINRLRLDAGSAYCPDDDSNIVFGRLFVDEIEIDGRFTVHASNLARAAAHSGAYWIFTCGCGDAGCANIFEPVYVGHGREYVQWRVREPAPARTWVFAKADYRRAIATGLRCMIGLSERLPGRSTIGPYGHEIQDLREGFRRAAGMRSVERRGKRFNGEAVGG